MHAWRGRVVSYFLRATRWVKAEPAAVFVALLELALRKALDAAVAARTEVTFGGARCCASAEPAADFEVLLASLLRRTFEAAVAARLLVTSDLLAIANSLGCLTRLLDYIYWRRVIKN